MAELYTARPDVNLEARVSELALEEAVPFLAAFRYTEDGLKKRVQWERTWDLQRREDAIDARTKLPAADPRHLSPDAAASLKKQGVGDIPVQAPVRPLTEVLATVLCAGSWTCRRSAS